MSTILRPDSDTTAKWVEDPVGDAFEVLDDAVTQPTAPTTGSDRIISDGSNNQICNVGCTSYTLLGGERGIRVTLWVYGKCTDGDMKYDTQVADDSGTLTQTLARAHTSFQWTSDTADKVLSQTNINALQAVMITDGTGANVCEIDAAYIELETQFTYARNMMGVGA